ncbi:hypothetical protein CR513_14556, partial [Mucuna pruriens]
MKQMFLEKFFLASRTATIRKEICGLMMMDQNMIDATSGGALMDKTPTVARHLISNMASNAQQLGTKGAVIKIDNLRLENQLTKLTSLVRQLAFRQHQRVHRKHPTDMCPALQEIGLDNAEIVGSIGGYQYVGNHIQVDKVAAPTKSESRVVYGPEIRICTKHASFELESLSVASSEIPSTIIPTITTTTGSATGQFTFDGRVNEAVECE